MTRYIFMGISGLTCLCYLSLMIISCNKGDKVENTPTVSISPRNDFEGTGQNEMMDVTFRLSSPASSSVTITFSTVDSTAIGSKDFLPISEDTVTFKPGETSKKIYIEIIADSIVEYTEYFKILISHAENANIGKAYLTIALYNDDIAKTTLVSDGYISPESYPDMKLRFADEFNDSTLSYFNWNIQYGEGKWGQDQLQEYTTSPENIMVKDGKLRIAALNKGGHYTSGRINTVNKISFQYGQIDIRVKLPRGKGLWPAIWLLGSGYNGSNWPAVGEVDLVEQNSYNAETIIGAAFYNSNGPREKEGFYSLPDYTESFSDQFHIVSILWQKDNIEWFVDSKKYLEFNYADIPNDWPFNYSFDLFLDLAVGGTMVGEPDNTTVFPQSMEVDYIRVFKPI